MAALNEGFRVVSSMFKIPDLNVHQKQAIRKIIVDKEDIFVNLPTGFGKSLIYQALPLVFDHVSKQTGHIVVVVSPLVSLMEDQVQHLRSLGVSAVNISTKTEIDRSKIEKGEYSVVYGSPEAWLMNERWRSTCMLGNDVYTSKLCAVAVDEAHVLRQWGTSEDKKKAAFRDCYGHLHELRSLAPNARMIALTATATKLTKATILSVLLMQKPFEIKESPNKPNVTYVVECMRKDTDHELYFEWLVDELKTKQVSCDRTIIYCQTIKQCGVVYGTIKGMLGKDMYPGTGNDPTNVLVEMLHSCTPVANKDKILHSFQSVTGTIRLLIATIAFGMGVDCKGVRRVVHYGPSKSIEAYVQETGRAGRDGSQSAAYILYHGILLNHIDGHMKEYVKTHECRRKELLKHFDYVVEEHNIPHLCCDICASKCDCGLPDCGIFAAYPLHQRQATASPSVREREVHPEQVKVVKDSLTRYYKSLVIKLVNTTAHGNVKTLTNLKFMLGFSEHQITQVIENLGMIFTLSDVFKVVEIWDKRHALKIISVISDVFNDASSCNQSFDLTPEDKEYDFDDELLDEWNEVLQDDDLFDMIVDNLSLSQLQNSLLEEELVSNDSLEAELPSTVLANVEMMNLDDSS